MNTPDKRAEFSHTAAGPNIPGDDIPLTPEEEAHFEQLARDIATRRTERPSTLQPITGYRALTGEEIQLINTVKAKGVDLDQTIKTAQVYLINQRRAAARLPLPDFDAELKRIDTAEPNRWAAIARTHFQEGLMALTRAIAQPSNF